MAGFQLTQGQNTFNLDLSGNLNDNTGKKIGKWSTSGDTKNQIVVKPDAGTATSIGVGWKFDDNNQLGIVDTTGKLIFNLHSGGSQPLYSTQKAVLRVKPDMNNAFAFQLHADWEVDANHNLLFKTETVTSPIDGFIQDTKSRFNYTFFNKQDLSQRSVLTFTGRWDYPDKNKAAGLAKLDFVYDKENDQSGTFVLPQGVSIDRSVNQLMYSYDKQGQTFKVQFAGLLEVSPDFQINYTIDRQVTGTGQQQVALTKVTMQAAITKKNFSGDVEFVLLKQDGKTPGPSSLSIKGGFTAKFGQAKIQVGFAFTQVRGGNPVPSTIFFNGTLTLGSGTQFSWVFERNATTTTVQISVTNIQLGGARGIIGLDFKKENGQIVGVQALFGVAF